MKRTPEERKAYSAAMKRLYYFSSVMGSERTLYANIDRRTRYGKLVAKYIAENRYYFGEQMRCVENKRKRTKRRNNPPYKFVPLMENPIVKDWLNNKCWCNWIAQDHLQFDGWRNHWAKTATDYRWLSILRKYHPEKAK